MANILDRYGIKEVADVTFYKLSDAGLPEYPVLYLDTLKVSTIAQTAQSTDAKGGKGNAALISWDYGKEINVTLEDALFSAKSMAIMFGNGTVKTYGSTGSAQYIMKSEQWAATSSNSSAASAGWSDKYEGPDGKLYIKTNPKHYNANGGVASTFVAGEKYFCSFDIAVAGSVIEVSASSFPGTYYVTGDTYARSEASGDDEFFQFIIPKAKVQSENTITLQAEGDPSTFNMSLKVLRPADGVMMKLVKYDALGGSSTSEGASADLIHNHTLVVNNASDEPDRVVPITWDAAAATHTTEIADAEIQSGDTAAVTGTGIASDPVVAAGKVTVTQNGNGIATITISHSGSVVKKFECQCYGYVAPQG